MSVELSSEQSTRLVDELDKLAEQNLVIVPDFFDADQVNALLAITLRVPKTPEFAYERGRHSTRTFDRPSIAPNRGIFSALLQHVVKPLWVLGDHLSEEVNRSTIASRHQKWVPNLLTLNDFVSRR